jgi:hypothetical protein
MGLSYLQACEINFEALVFLDKLIHGEPAFPFAASFRVSNQPCVTDEAISVLRWRQSFISSAWATVAASKIVVIILIFIFLILLMLIDFSLSTPQPRVYSVLHVSKHCLSPCALAGTYKLIVYISPLRVKNS